MTAILRVPRSRGALSGVLLVLLGAWGGLVAFVGPYFHYAYTPDHVWVYNSGRFWLEILPGIAAVVGGLILLASAYRPMALFGAWLAALSGAWFALGTVLSSAWRNGSINAGVPVGGALHRAAEQIGFFTGLGLVIMLFAALALGRLSVVSVRDARLAERVLASETAEQDAAAAAARDSAARDSAARDSAARDSAARDSAARESAGRDSDGSVPASEPVTVADSAAAPARTGLFARWNRRSSEQVTEPASASTAPASPADAESASAEDASSASVREADTADDDTADDDTAHDDTASPAAGGTDADNERLAATSTTTE